MESDNLKEKRAQLKAWLALHGLSRKEFAEKIGMHITSVNGWFSNVNIPDKKWEEIEKLFSAPKVEKQPIRQRVLGSVFSDEEVTRILKAAGENSLEEYLRIAILKETDSRLSEE